jgi:diguanylate cyclase (GGDEF)-like protein/PAS domain S-box-containing protein
MKQLPEITQLTETEKEDLILHMWLMIECLHKELEPSRQQKKSAGYPGHLFNKVTYPEWFKQYRQSIVVKQGSNHDHKAKASDQEQSDLQAYALKVEQHVVASTEELQLAYQKLADKEHRLRALVNAAPVGIAELDPKGYCRYLNPAGCALIACSEETVQGLHISEFVHPDDLDYFEFVWHTDSNHEKVNWLEFRLRNTGYWISAHWTHLFSTGRPFTGSIIVLVDNTEQRCKDEQLWVQAHYDGLTSLPNRNLFWERLMQNLRRAKRARQQVAVLWIDLDGFKSVNDHWGHAVGDELLIKVACRLNSRMRDTDTVARMGGDEFAVILPDMTEIEKAEQVTAELAALLTQPFTLKCGVSYITASIGIALYPLHTEDAGTLVRYADLAMYAAKRAGKNQVAIWQSDMAQITELRSIDGLVDDAS